MANWLTYANRGATRNQPLSPELVEKLGAFLPDMGINMEVFSGGQDATGPHRTGSHRHDHGGAADAFFYKDGRKLDWANPNDLPVFEDLVSRAKAAGITGIGAGEGYMRPGSMHIGMGSPSVWGAGGKGRNAPDWLRRAYGQPGGLSLGTNPVAPAASVIHPEISPSVQPAASVGTQPVGVPAMDGPKGAEVDVGQFPPAPTPSFWDNAAAAFKNPASPLMSGLAGLVGAMGGQREAPSAPIQSTLPSMEAGDAARAQGAAQLMATLLASKKKKPMGLTIGSGV